MRPQFIGLLAILSAVTVEALAQLFLKVGAAGGKMVLLPAYRAWFSRLDGDAPARTWYSLGVAAYALEILLYTLALHYLDVSVAFPIGSLCFVGVALLSKVFLGEVVNRKRWLGIGLILAGTVFVSL